MNTCINLLVIEDNPADFRLIVRHLEKHGLTARCHCVADFEGLQAAVAQGGWDAVLSDYSVPKLDFQHTLGVLQARHPDLPLILVSGSVGEEQAVELLKQGVWDFVLKDSLARLVPAIGRSLRDVAERRARQAAERARRAAEVTLHESEERFRTLFAAMTEGVALHELTYDDNGRPVDYVLLDVNPAFTLLTGLGREAVVGRRASEVFGGAAPYLETYADVAITGRAATFETTFQPMKKTFSIAVFSPAKGDFATVFSDISERKQRETALRDSEAKFRGLFESSRDAIMTLEPGSWRFTSANPATVAMFGANNEAQFISLGPWELSPERQPDGRASEEKSKEMIETALREGSHFFEWTHRRIGGEEFPADVLLTRMEQAGKLMLQVSIRDSTERLRASETQRASELRYRRLFESAKDGILILDAETGRVVDVNPFLIEMLGFSHEAFLGKPVWELGFFKDILANQDHFAKLQEQEYIRYEDMALETADGRRIEVEFVSNVYRVNHLKVIQCNIRDIAARKRAEEKLRESEWRFRDLLKNISSVAVQSYGYDGTTHYWNHASEKLYGYTAEEAIGKNLLDLIIPPEMGSGVRQAIQQMAETGQPIPASELTLRRKDGSRVVVFSSHAIVQPPGQPPELFCIDIDFTERKRTEESHARLATAVEHAAEMIVITDRNGAILHTNPAFTKITGYTREEVMGQKTSLLKSGKQDAEFYRQMWAVLTAGQIWSGHMVNKRKDGTLFEEDSSISPVLDAAGQIVNYVAVKHDVTEQKKLEAQYLRAQRMESVGRLAGGIAHDLNNILAPILMGASLLREGLSPEEAGPLIDTMADSAQRGADIIKQLLTFARGTEGQKVPLPPGRLINEMAAIVRETFPKSITLRLKSAQHLWPVLGDPTQLHQVLLNLCVNARDAMPEGGTLTLAAENLTLDDCYAAMSPEAKAGPYVVLQVSDTGTGMTPEIMDKIFEPFFTTKGVETGTGLGLATVQGIVKSHEGFIQVESQEGRGSCFRFYLPAQPKAETAAAATPVRDLPHGNGELVLVVDDEQNVRDITGRILKKHGYRVLTATDGARAVGLYAQHRAEIQVVLTDMLMPVMDGPATMRVLRQMNPQIKIIAASGTSSKVKLSEIAALSVQAYLPKPFTTERLLITLQEVLRGDGTRWEAGV